MNNLIENLYNEDIIYHYTKTVTAIDYILYNQQLKFNQRKKSNDPIENRNAQRNIEYTGERKNECLSECYCLDEYASSLEDQFYQICFCKNNMEENLPSNYNFDFSGNEELFGFIKPRMWDQYADKFTGVCIAFSKNKILSLNGNRSDLIKDDIDYLTFNELKTKKLGDIDADHLLNVGAENYKEEIDAIIGNSFFYKHKDYVGENEYRIGIKYNKDIGKIIGETIPDKLDISECIEAIIISSFANDKQKHDLLDYANELHFKIIEIDWQYNSFSYKDYRQWIKVLDMLAYKK
jgi:hypothetical protein